MTTTPVAIVGAAESSEIGEVADRSELHLATDAARRALADCGLEPHDVDGIASASLRLYPTTALARALGIEPRWTDATTLGGCSSLMHVRHAAAAIAAGQADVVLVAHGESGRSRIGAGSYRLSPDSLQGQFEAPYGAVGPMNVLTLGALRWLRDRGLGRETLADVAVAQRTWATRNPRALRRDPITVDEVLSAPLVAYPFTRPMCCVVTDAGGAVILTSAERARDLRRPAVHLLGAGEAAGVSLVAEMGDLTSSGAFRRAGAAAFADAGVGPADLDHAMLYDAVAYLPLLALEDLGIVEPGAAGAFYAEGHTSPGGSLPVNTTGGGLNYTHSGMYAMYALLESVRQLRNEAAAQVDGVEISLVHGIGGMFQTAATLILANRRD